MQVDVFVRVRPRMEMEKQDEVRLAFCRPHAPPYPFLSASSIGWGTPDAHVEEVARVGSGPGVHHRTRSVGLVCVPSPSHGLAVV